MTGTLRRRSLTRLRSVTPGAIPPAEPQEIVLPKVPVKKVKVTLSRQKKKKIAVEDVEAMVELEVVEIERD